MHHANRTIVLTGATSGIGLAAARILAPTAATLVLHGPQSQSAATGPLDTIREVVYADAVIHYVQSDFTRPDAARRLADSILDLVSEVDVLVNNAAIPGGPHRRLAPSGVELTFHVNFLCTVALTNLLLPTIATEHGRIVNVASATHLAATLDLDDLSFDRRGYTGPDAYAQSKLAIVTYSRWLAAHIRPTVVSVHPGVIATSLLHTMFNIGGAPPERGGENVVQAIGADVPSGTYLDEQTPADPNPTATDLDCQRRLRERAAELLGLDVV